MPIVPLRDRLVLRELPSDVTPGGITIITDDEAKRKRDMAKSSIRCVVVAQGPGMLIGETGDKFETPFPRLVPAIQPSEDNPDGQRGHVENWNLVGKTVIVSHFAGFEDEDPITREKHIIVTPLDIQAIVED